MTYICVYYYLLIKNISVKYISFFLLLLIEINNNKN